MLNRFIVFLSLLFISLALGGCASSQASKKSQYSNSFNPNDKRIVFVEGKPFDVPRLANYSPRRVTSKEAKGYQNMGITCHKGDLLWIYGLKSEELSVLVRKGYMQCAYPMGTQEYQYRLNKEKERDRVLNELAGFNTQKIRVEHSGSIYHY